VGDWKGYVANREGINPFKLAEYVQRTGRSSATPAARPSPRAEFFAVEADIFVPGALELEIGAAEAQALRCKVIVEGANGPTDPRAEPIIAEQGNRPDPRHPGQLGRRLRQLLRVAAEQAQRELGPGRGGGEDWRSA
jgi:glutamate dehydrogenase/leucine dehydrogenase